MTNTTPDYTKPEAWLAKPRDETERAITEKLARLEGQRRIAVKLARVAEASDDRLAARDYWRAAARCEAEQDALAFDL